MRIILASEDDVLGQAKAALAAINYYASGAKGQFLGLRIDGRFYGVKLNKGSMRVYPQHNDIGDQP